MNITMLIAGEIVLAGLLKNSLGEGCLLPQFLGIISFTTNVTNKTTEETFAPDCFNLCEAKLNRELCSGANLIYNPLQITEEVI